jgi:hypothetical protein
MGLYAKDRHEAFTANGDTAGLGFATVASNVGFKVGATAWLRGTALTTVQCTVESLVSTDKIGLRFKLFTPGFPDREIPTYGRSSLASYTLAAASTISQEAGVVPNDL